MIMKIKIILNEKTKRKDRILLKPETEEEIHILESFVSPNNTKIYPSLEGLIILSDLSAQLKKFT